MKKSILCVLLVVLFVLTACGKASSVPEISGTPSNGVELSKTGEPSIPGEMSGTGIPSVSTEELLSTVCANTELSYELFYLPSEYPALLIQRMEEAKELSERTDFVEVLLTTYTGTNHLPARNISEPLENAAYTAAGSARADTLYLMEILLADNAVFDKMNEAMKKQTLEAVMAKEIQREGTGYALHRVIRYGTASAFYASLMEQKDTTESKWISYIEETDETAAKYLQLLSESNLSEMKQTSQILWEKYSEASPEEVYSKETLEETSTADLLRLVCAYPNAAYWMINVPSELITMLTEYFNATEELLQREDLAQALFDAYVTEEDASVSQTSENRAYVLEVLLAQNDVFDKLTDTMRNQVLITAKEKAVQRESTAYTLHPVIHYGTASAFYASIEEQKETGGSKWSSYIISH